MTMTHHRRSASFTSDLDIRRVRTRPNLDLEKHDFRLYREPDEESQFEDDEYEHSDHSTSSSRSVSSPMLQTARSFAKARNRFKFSRVRLRGCNPVRCVCLGLAMLLVFFIMSLIQMSWASDAAVRLAVLENKISHKPPLWEEFTFLPRYWGGLRSLVPYEQNIPEYPKTGKALNITEKKEAEDETLPSTKTIPQSVVFDPYPNYTSPAYRKEFGEKIDCFLDDKGTIPPSLRVYHGRPNGFPEPVIGDPELLGMKHDICYDRYGRFGPYGLGYTLNKGGSGAMLAGEREGAELVWSHTPEVDYRDVRWVQAQDHCIRANAHRFDQSHEAPYEQWRAMRMNGVSEKTSTAPAAATSTKLAGLTKVPRTAIVIRTWHDRSYTTEDILYLRSLVTELSLNSGGEYTLHFLVHLKDNNGAIWNDPDSYDRYLHDALPPEFRGMGTLWTEAQMNLIYPGLEDTPFRDLPLYGVYRSNLMPLQYFASQHPEYDFFWNWEMDSRNTGHWYHFFDSVTTWAKQQPRKYLWERNGRFYVPSEHGTWEEFGHMVRVHTEQGTNSPNNIWSGIGPGGKKKDPAKPKGDKSIWGPERPLDDETDKDLDQEAPTTFEKDKYEWGVGEEADLITLNPLFDPDGTSWLWADDTAGYNTTRGQVPRRVAIITSSRLSRRLLMTMHRETGLNHHTMFSEMWPASAALHHGLKAVYVPHPVYVDRDWPTAYLEATFNAGRNGASGGARTSIFGAREHNFDGTTWFYSAKFASTLWSRWLGLRMHNDGGELFETTGEGRMCLPAMLLHPIKEIVLPQEGRREGE